MIQALLYIICENFTVPNPTTLKAAFYSLYNNPDRVAMSTDDLILSLLFVIADNGLSGGEGVSSIDASAVTTGVFNSDRIPVLDAGKVATGTFNPEQIPDLNAAKITAGTLDPGVVPNLDAAKITTGAFSLDRIPDLNAAKVTTGTFSLDRIPDLNAAKITAGTLDTARIPSLDAGKVTTGTFNPDRIPNLDAGKISTGTIAIARLPVGTDANSVAAGNDARFHTPNTDTGTTADTFQINSDSGGARIGSTNGSTITFRTSDNLNYADAILDELTATTLNVTTLNATQVNFAQVNEVAVGDNMMILNTDYVGASPTENGGFVVNRGGTLANAEFYFNETDDDWYIGLTGAMLRVARSQEFPFTSANLVAGILTITHALGKRFVGHHLYDQNGKQVSPPATCVNSTTFTYDLTGITVSGTWTARLSA